MTKKDIVKQDVKLGNKMKQYYIYLLMGPAANVKRIYGSGGPGSGRTRKLTPEDPLPITQKRGTIQDLIDASEYIDKPPEPNFDVPSTPSSRNSMSKSSSPDYYTAPSSPSPPAPVDIHDYRDTENNCERPSNPVRGHRNAVRQQLVGIPPLPPVSVYTPQERQERIERWKAKKAKDSYGAKRVRYQVRKNSADSRNRVKGRFVSTKGGKTKKNIRKLAKRPRKTKRKNNKK